MHPRDLAAHVFRRGKQYLAVPLCALTLLLPAPADAEEACDFSGFDQPCQVQDGVYRALIPEGEGPFPVMVYLYGSGGQAASITNHPLFDASVVQRGYALIVPAALGMEYGRGVYDTGWDLRHEPGGSRDEVLFLNRVLDDAGRRFSVDRDQVLVVGQSRGAFLIWEIACHEPETATAYASHAGGYLGNLPEDCERPVRFLHGHGRADPIVPYTGKSLVSGGITMATLESSLGLLAETNQCGGPSPATDEVTPDLKRRSWDGCAAGSSLDLLVHEGGHAMPADWFRTVIDWFEEPPAEIEEVTPLTHTAGVRPSSRFKAVPRSGPALMTTATEPVPGRRIQVPGASKNDSQ